MVSFKSIHPPLWRFGGWAFAQKAVGWCEGPLDCDCLHSWICAFPHLHKLLYCWRESVKLEKVRTSTENTCVSNSCNLTIRHSFILLPVFFELKRPILWKAADSLKNLLSTRCNVLREATSLFHYPFRFGPECRASGSSRATPGLQGLQAWTSRLHGRKCGDIRGTATSAFYQELNFPAAVGWIEIARTIAPLLSSRFLSIPRLRRSWGSQRCRRRHPAFLSPCCQPELHVVAWRNPSARGWRRHPPQGGWWLLLAVWRQPAVLADCKVVEMRMMRMSTLQTCMLEKHMSESAWWCFLSSGVPMGSHMSVVTCMKVCVLADSGSGLPMLKVKMDYPTTPYERLDGAMLGTPAGRLWHFESRCMSEGVVGLGWSGQAFQVFEDNLGDCSKIGNLLPNGRVWPCVSVLVAKKVVTSGVEN